MKSPSPIFSLTLCALLGLSITILTAQENPVSFYIAYQWPGSYCAAAKQDCCYPKSIRKHPGFTIGGIWPYTFSGDIPTNCKSETPFSLSKISNLTKSLERNWPSLSCPGCTSSKQLWMQEWQKYGTCAESLFGGQYQYFHAGLNLRKIVDMLLILRNAGIHPNGSFYKISEISNAIQEATIYIPGFACKKEKSGNQQLYQIILWKHRRNQNHRLRRPPKWTMSRKGQVPSLEMSMCCFLFYNFVLGIMSVKTIELRTLP